MLGNIAMGRKVGMANVLLSTALVIMCIISLSFITTNLSAQPKRDVVEIAINNNVYPIRDSLEVTKLDIDKWAGYSIHQALYENGLRGGFPSADEDSLLEYDGVKYRLWYNNIDLAPEEIDIKNGLETATMEKFLEYTDEADVGSYFTVGVPRYSKIDIDNVNDYGIEMALDSNSDVSLKRTAENGDVITVSRDSLVKLSLRVPYYLIYHAAMDYHDMLHEPFEERLLDCEKTEVERTIDKPGYTLESRVMDTQDGSCLVRVDVATKNGIKVLVDKKTVEKKIRLVFMERRGPEQCRLCMSSGSLNAQCKGTCDDDEYPSRTVFKNIDECKSALDGTLTGFSDDTQFFASKPAIDTLTLSLNAGGSVVDLLERFSEGTVDPEHTPPQSRLRTTPSSGGDYRIACAPGGSCTRMFCELKGLYHECFDFDSPESSMLSEQEKEIVSLEAQSCTDASSECQGDIISSGPWSIYNALMKIGINTDFCDIIHMRKPGLLSLKRFLGAFGEEPMPITWPDQLVMVLQSQGAAVQRMTGDDDELRRVAAEEAEKPGKAVIIRVSLDERNKLLSQHYELLRKDQAGEYYYIESHVKPIHEVYIISNPAA